MSGSRTINSAKNSIVALIMYVINLILQFYSRKIFLEYLGSEILGLNSTASNLLQFLNIAELGVGSAVAFVLYKPLCDNNYNSINEIINFQGKIYGKIATAIVCGALIMSCFFPLIFNKIQLPLWYAYASFGVLLFSALLGYYVNYKQVLLTADQKDYKVQFSYRITITVKTILQMLAMVYVSNGYMWWLIFEVVFAIIGSLWLIHIVKKNYPYLKKEKASFKHLNNKYPVIFLKIKQLFIHKVASFALFQLSPIIIYAYENLNSVTLYSNYIIVTSGIISLFSASFNGITASIGNLLTENPRKSFNLFAELFSIRFYISTICVIIFYLYVDSFISLWIGSEYLMPKSTLILITLSLYCSLLRQTLDNYLTAYALYSDIGAPIFEIILNVSLSVLLGHFYGLNGIIGGMLISIISVVLIWKPYFLFSRGIRISVWNYWKIFFTHLMLAIMTFIIAQKYIFHLFEYYSGWIGWIINVAITIIGSGILLLILMNMTRCGIVLFEKRLMRLAKELL